MVELPAVCGFEPVFDILNFYWAWSQISLFNDVAKKQHSLCMKLTFFPVYKESVLK